MSALSGDSRRRGDPWQRAGAVFLAVLIVFSLLPMAWMLLTSIKTQFAALQFPPEWIPHNPTLANYIALLSPQADVGREFLRYMVNSLWVSFASTVLGVAVAVPAAYAFSRFRFPGRNLLFYGVLLRNMFPAVVFLMPLFIMMRWLGLVGTQSSLILTYLTFGLPLSIWLLKGFYDNIPVQLEQAARIDGASRFRAFLLIVMPLSSPGIIATAIYSFILAWNEYVYALTFLNDQSRADPAGRIAALLHRIRHQLAWPDGCLVHHERAGRGVVSGAAEILRPRTDRGRRQILKD